MLTAVVHVSVWCACVTNISRLWVQPHALCILGLQITRERYQVMGYLTPVIYKPF